jgi:hypothetical protein
MDMTRGALTYTHQNYPGAYHSSNGIAYVTVAGAAVPGAQRHCRCAQLLSVHLPRRLMKLHSKAVGVESLAWRRECRVADNCR